MRTQRICICFIALALSGMGCGDDDARTADAGETDAGVTDAGPADSGAQDAGMRDAGSDEDAGQDAGADAGAPTPGDTMVQTSGGAMITTSEYRLRISVGAPQPAGSRSNSTHRLRLGPVPR